MKREKKRERESLVCLFELCALEFIHKTKERKVRNRDR